MIGYVGRIERQTLKNNYFRQVLFTGKHAQLVVMCLQRGEAIGDEVHRKVDQFFRIEQGEAKFIFNEKEEHVVHDGEAVIVPAGTFHNVINTGKGKLKLCTPYIHRQTTLTARFIRPRPRRKKLKRSIILTEWV